MPITKPRRRTMLSSLLAIAAIAGCAHPAPTGPTAPAYLVVRHAEKVDASRDPDLSAAGHARAQALAERLDGLALAAVYATEFKRTAQTVAPSAAARAITITAYPASQPAAGFAAGLRTAHPRGTVLIAGHSNTVPGIVAALCGCEVAPMPDHEYDRLSIIRVDPDGQPRLEIERYGAASPTP